MVTRVDELLKLGFYKPIAVDDLTRTILDRYQKTAEAGRLGLDLVAVLPVDHHSDERITVEVWLKVAGRRSPRLTCSRWPRRARCFRLRPPDK